MTMPHVTIIVTVTEGYVALSSLINGHFPILIKGVNGHNNVGYGKECVSQEAL